MREKPANQHEKAVSNEWIIRQAARALKNAPPEVRREILIRSMGSTTLDSKVGKPAK
jgi:hypothetical protein